LTAVPAAGPVNLNTANFEELRNHKLSVTQATRVLAYRERLGGYKSVDDLDQVPGFPKDFLREFKARARV
jgi:DNA uptake protein ComE-like DNA-binding protein